MNDNITRIRRKRNIDLLAIELTNHPGIHTIYCGSAMLNLFSLSYHCFITFIFYFFVTYNECFWKENNRNAYSASL